MDPCRRSNPISSRPGALRHHPWEGRRCRLQPLGESCLIAGGFLTRRCRLRRMTQLAGSPRGDSAHATSGTAVVNASSLSDGGRIRFGTVVQTAPPEVELASEAPHHAALHPELSPYDAVSFLELAQCLAERGRRAQLEPLPDRPRGAAVEADQLHTGRAVGVRPRDQDVEAIGQPARLDEPGESRLEHPLLALRRGQRDERVVANRQRPPPVA